MTTNVMLRDLDLFLPQGADGRRLEVVADGLPLFDGAQLAVDTTLVSPLHCDGSARPGAPSTDGVALSAARRRKERAYPELVGPHRRARLVVLAGEVGGRWSEETQSFISQLAKAKSRAEPFVSRRRVEQAWARQQGRLLHHSWSVAPQWVQMVQPLCPTKWKGISGTQGWGLEWMRRVWGSRVTMSFEPLSRKKKNQDRRRNLWM